MKTPFIVLTPAKMRMEEPFDQKYTYTNGYNTAAIVNAGGVPVLAGFMDEEQALQLMERADGLFMTGGADIEPSLYGEEKQPYCGATQPERDSSDCNLLKAALKLKKPVICICRGCQIANVFLGGTMYQDLPTQMPGDVKHSVYDEYMKESTHTVKVEEGSPLHKLTGKTEIGVNSLHHQGIKTTGKGVVPMAWSPDGLVESWYYDDDTQYLRAYQWHPEMSADSINGINIFADFMKAVKENMK